MKNNNYKKNSKKHVVEMTDKKNDHSNEMEKLIFTNKTIALVGRVNVGKSTLFNALARKKLAITLPIAGTTRDYQEAYAKTQIGLVKIVDTAGFQLKKSDDLNAWDGTEISFKSANLLLFVVSAGDGVLLEDLESAQLLRPFSKKVILVINKCDKSDAKYDLGEFYKLGFNPIVKVSCKNNAGLGELRALIGETLREEVQRELSNLKRLEEECERNRVIYDQQAEAEMEGEEGESEFEYEPFPEEEIDAPIKIAIVGRPNAGKSTILNGILGENRVLTSPIAGTTRDAIKIEYFYEDKAIELIDTAGIRRKSKNGDEIESESVKMAIKSIEAADVIFVVIDVTQALDRQDLHLADFASKCGKVPVLIFNKWDLIKEEQRDAVIKWIEHTVMKSFAQINVAECIFMSAIDTKQDYQIVFDVAIDLYKIWTAKIGTGQINQILQKATIRQPAPLVGGRRLKAKYAVQISAAPTKIAVFFSQDASRVPPSYVSFLRNSFANGLKLYGVPVIIECRYQGNPWGKKH